MVLAGAALFQSALLGVWINITGIFLAQIRVEMGLSVTQVSMYYTCKNIGASLLGAVLAGIFFKSNKKIYMAVMMLAEIFSALLLVVGADTWLWYVSAAACSLVQGCSGIMVPYVLNPWFGEKAGLATGTVMAASGLASALISPLASYLIEGYGWRTAVFWMCGIMAVMALASLVLMFRHEAPQQKNSAKAAVSGRSAQKPAREKSEGKFLWGTFLACCLIFLSGTILMQFTQYISIYAQAAGYSLTIGAALTSIHMVGNTAGKFLFGVFEDALGVWRSIMIAFACIFLSSVCMIFFSSCLSILYVATLGYGMVYALVMISVSRGSIAAYGEEKSKGYVGIHVSINNAAGAIFAMLIGMVYDYTLSFIPILGFGAVFCLMAGGAAFALDRRDRRRS